MEVRSAVKMLARPIKQEITQAPVCDEERQASASFFKPDNSS